ncbi:sigma-54-dependent transcriptional regulator [Desulfoluna butyratoxydans]|uniref:Rna polymerase sigma factor 54 interaction domain n=1 Tax=Desulfoluna butyratoxydans TaxID=231438 RepID=A0A4U8YI09_9BACT|nr:sigma 54-interacting transcriptional regulator [Desulfoluna butyratoxydans]VFQ42897.1 rna polymerase sigma factor 54 interaction domain [Desulfoluna butyratoxydans]
MIRLTDTQRIFFALVSEAIYANPFAEEREAIDTRIAGLFPGARVECLIDETIREVSARLEALEPSGRPRIDRVEKKDKTLVENALVFEFFYLFRERFDALIHRQVEAGDTSLPVPFADEARAFFQDRGFTTEQFCHYMALCYQLRRAFLLIRDSLVGESRAMRNLRRDLWNNVFTHDIGLYARYLINRMEDFSTLLLGETGTGKGTAAIAIGRSGYIPFDPERKTFTESFTRTFVSLNLSQYPETLLESELFGHKKGAFTGAVEDHKGVLERCSPNGAIFLDELGEIPAHTQIKLLQVLQEREFTPVGSHLKTRFNGRVIAATNRPFEEITGSGGFRDDFFYRLCSDIITVPPLRVRIEEDPEELTTLLNHTVTRMVGKASPEYTDMVREVIERQLGPHYPWPGNVRELEQCTRRVLIKKSYLLSRDTDDTSLTEALARGIRNGEMDLKALTCTYCAMLYRRYGTYGDVARITGLDRRTAKKYIETFDAD